MYVFAQSNETIYAKWHILLVKLKTIMIASFKNMLLAHVCIIQFTNLGGLIISFEPIDFVTISSFDAICMDELHKSTLH